MKPAITVPEIAAVDLRAISEAIGKCAPLSPACTRTRQVLNAAIDALRIVTDDVAAQVIDLLAMELADAADRLTVRELMLSQALQLAHDKNRENARQDTRLRDLLDLARSARNAR